MICPKCGEKAENEQKFCGKCGYDFSEAENEEFAVKEETMNHDIEETEDAEESEYTEELTSESEKKKLKKGLKMAILGIVAIAIIITSISLYLNSYTHIYNKGKALYKEGRYSEAYDTLLNLVGDEESGDDYYYYIHISDRKYFEVLPEPKDFFKVTYLMKQCYYANEEDVLKNSNFSIGDVFKIESLYLSYLKEYGFDEEIGYMDGYSSEDENAYFDGMMVDVVGDRLIFHNKDYSSWGDFSFALEKTGVYTPNVESYLKYNINDESGIICVFEPDFSDFSDEGNGYTIAKVVTSADGAVRTDAERIYDLGSNWSNIELLHFYDGYIYFSERDYLDINLWRISIEGEKPEKLLSDDFKLSKFSIGEISFSGNKMYYSLYNGSVSECLNWGDILAHYEVNLDDIDVEDVKVINEIEIPKNEAEIESDISQRYKESIVEAITSYDCIGYVELRDTMYYIAEDNTTEDYKLYIYKSTDDSLETVDLPRGGEFPYWELRKTESQIILCNVDDEGPGEIYLEFYTIDSENKMKRLS